MTAPYLFRTHGAAISTAATTITHGLSRTASRLFAHVTPRGVNTNSWLIGLSTITANTVVLVASAAGTTADVAVLEYHSIQGGPN